MVMIWKQFGNNLYLANEGTFLKTKFFNIYFLISLLLLLSLLLAASRLISDSVVMINELLDTFSESLLKRED